MARFYMSTRTRVNKESTKGTHMFVSTMRKEDTPGKEIERGETEIAKRQGR